MRKAAGAHAWDRTPNEWKARKAFCFKWYVVREKPHAKRKRFHPKCNAMFVSLFRRRPSEQWRKMYMARGISWGFFSMLLPRLVQPSKLGLVKHANFIHPRCWLLEDTRETFGFVLVLKTKRSWLFRSGCASEQKRFAFDVNKQIAALSISITSLHSCMYAITYSCLYAIIQACTPSFISESQSFKHVHNHSSTYAIIHLRIVTLCSEKKDLDNQSKLLPVTINEWDDGVFALIVCSCVC